MSPEQQRIAIAEACGTAPHYKVGSRDGYECKYCGISWRLVKGACGFNPEFPDYLNDLNAMHEAEKLLTDDQWHCYFDLLVATIAGSVSAPNHSLYPRVIRATAAQRAAAFLRTIGKWVE